ncbi:MAG: VacJ family lipoprotein [Pseudomonadota bacterium]
MRAASNTDLLENLVGNARKLAVLSLLLVTLSACASTGNSVSEDGVYDPIQPFNRQVFAFNDAVDEIALEPAAELYRDTLPRDVRVGISNVLRNLRTPVIFGNQVLQGDLDGAGKALVRFVTNTLAGLGGLLDPAGENGFEYEQEDFGQTLAVWGVGEGPYLVLPLLGPSNVRDTVGFIVDSLADPLSIIADNQHVGAEYTIATSGGFAISERAKALAAIREIKDSSVDYYASLRNLYQQRRDGLIADGAPDINIPDFDDISEFDDFDDGEVLDPEEQAAILPPSIMGGARLAERVE